MFKVYSEAPFSQGFHMTFENGWTVSVQFGTANYADNRMGSNRSISAEIAAWNENDGWHCFDDESTTVKGYCSADEVAAFIAMIAAKES